MGKHLSDAPCNLATLTFSSEVMALVIDTDLPAPSVYHHSVNFVCAFQFGRYDALGDSINRPGDLDLLNSTL